MRNAETRSLLNFGIFPCIMRWDSSLNTKFINVSYIPNIYGLNVILYNIFRAPVF
jgi:hypothetical protein